MAHPNINERRDYVQKLLKAGVKINHRKMVEIGEKFNCSHSAIRADIIALTREPGSITPHVSQNLRRLIRYRDGLICQYCGKRDEWRDSLVEHIIPASIGGVAQAYNLVVACQSCN